MIAGVCWKVFQSNFNPPPDALLHEADAVHTQNENYGNVTQAARTLLHGFDLRWVLWLFVLAVGWFALAVFVFHRGLRRYASASS